MASCFILPRPRKLKKLCEEGDISGLHKLLLDGKEDPSIRNNEAIRLAALHGHLQVILELLKDSRVDPAANQNEALYNACLNGHEYVVQALLMDPRVKVTGEALYASIIRGSEEITEMLKERLEFQVGMFKKTNFSMKFQKVFINQ